MCGKKLEDLARKYQEGEELSVCDLSTLVRNKNELPEPVQEQLLQQMEKQVFVEPGDPDKGLSKTQRKLRRKRLYKLLQSQQA